MKTMRSLIFILSLVFAGVASAQPDYLDTALPTEKRIDDLMSRLTENEKFGLLGGTGFGSKPVPRLGIPSLAMIDGPQGIRGPRATAFPSTLTAVATWNPTLMRLMAAGIGREVRAIGKNMILGPCVSLYRVPQSGRNYECFGEDPFLNSVFARAYVIGTHDSKVASSTKHFLLNNEEYNRNGISAHIDERALHELELPAFEAAIAAGTESIMSSYNLVDGLHVSENRKLLSGLLKGELGFKGLVVSDWESTYDGFEAERAGLDLEMPFGDHLNSKLKQWIGKGYLSQNLFDDNVRRLLRALFAIGAMDGPQVAHSEDLNSKLNQRIALHTAEESLVLLKNENHLLPLKLRSVRSVALVGPGAAYRRSHAGGSGEVSGAYNVSVLDGLREAAKGKLKINFALGNHPSKQVELVQVFKPELGGGTVDGFEAEYFNNSDLSGEPVVTRRETDIQIWNTVAPDPKLEIGKYSARWHGKFVATQSGKTSFDFGVSCDIYRFYLDGQLIKDFFPSTADCSDQAFAIEDLKAGVHDLKIEFKDRVDTFKFSFGWIPPQPDQSLAIAAARTSDVVIAVLGSSGSFEGEASDRADLMLPGEQDTFIDELLKVNPNVIVVINSGGPVSMRAWRDRVPAILQAWFPGQEGGRAIARVILGLVNPSGKLPITIPKSIKDSPSSVYYPIDDSQKFNIDYSLVSVLEGYRGYDANKIEPEFPFGHGLSYTNFTYSSAGSTTLQSEARNPRVMITMTLANTGAVTGAEVVQLYVHQDHPQVTRAPLELKAFRKVSLKSGEKKKIQFELDASAFRYWDVKSHSWTVDADSFTIELGSSSRDLREQYRVVLK